MNLTNPGEKAASFLKAADYLAQSLIKRESEATAQDYIDCTMSYFYAAVNLKNPREKGENFLKAASHREQAIKKRGGNIPAKKYQELIQVYSHAVSFQQGAEKEKTLKRVKELSQILAEKFLGQDKPATE